LRQYLRILHDLILRDLRIRYAGSLMGALWSVGIPALNAIVLSAVFSVLMSGRMGVQYQGTPFALFYFAGFAPWVLFNEAVGRSAGIIVENAAIVKRVRFPLEALCLQVVGSSIIGHVVVLVVTGLLMLVHGVAPTPQIFWLPLLLLVTLTLTLGTALILSAVSVYVRDLTQLAPVALNILFFLTPILYPPALVENAPRWARLLVLDLNPWHYLVESYRYSILGTSNLPALGLLYTSGMAIAVLAIGLVLFRRLKHGFADVL
jgi:ABC-type polysaccharide/polyol phosphate export permease